MSLADDAIRLLRTDWGERANLLSQELYTIFLQYRDIDTGPVTLNLGDGQPAITIRPESLRDPFGQFRWPDFGALDGFRGGSTVFNRDSYLNQFNSNNVTFEETILDDGSQGRPRRLQRKRTELIPYRECMPGKIVSGSGSTYTVTLYPDGLENAGFNQSGVRQLQIDTNEIIPVDTWTLVSRHSKVEVSLVITVEVVDGMAGEREVSRSTNMRYANNNFYMQVPVWL